MRGSENYVPLFKSSKLASNWIIIVYCIQFLKEWVVLGNSACQNEVFFEPVSTYGLVLLRTAKDISFRTTQNNWRLSLMYMVSARWNTAIIVIKVDRLKLNKQNWFFVSFEDFFFSFILLLNKIFFSFFV